MPRREAFLRPREVQKSDARALFYSRRDLGRERGNRLYARVEVSQQLFAPEGRWATSGQLFGAVANAIARKPVFHFVANRATDPFGVDPTLVGRREAVDAEAEAK